MKAANSLSRRLINSFIGVGAMYVVSMPLGLLTSIILARTLGPQGFGQYAFIMSLLALLTLPASGGLPQLLTREVASYTHGGEWTLYRGVVRSAHVWVLILALVIIGFYFVTGQILGDVPNQEKWALLGIVLLMVPLEGLNAVRNGTIKGLGFPALAELPTHTIRPLLLVVAFIVLMWQGQLTIHTALWTQVVVVSTTFIVASILFYGLRPKESLLTRPDYRCRAWFFALLPFTLISVVGTFNAQIGILLLGTFGSDEAVAALRVGERGAQFVLLSLTLVNLVISPHIVRMYQDGNLQSLQRLSRQSARGAFIIALPIGLLLIILGKPILRLTFGHEYAEISYMPMITLVCGYLFHVAAGSSAILLVMCGYDRLTLFSQVAGLIVMVSLVILLVPAYQAMGAALASVAGVVTYTIMQAFLVVNRLKIRPGIF